MAGRRRKQKLHVNGWLIIDKPSGITSTGVCNVVKRLANGAKTGHGGTLDPLATGLMLLALGEGTKLLEFLLGCDKTYEVLARFGEVSDTFDAEGEVVFVSNKKIDQSVVEAMIFQRFLGDIEQMPPKYSALKVGGRRACDIVRAGGEVDLKARDVRIDRFEIVEWNWPEVKFVVDCGSGTYIRSLIADLGEALGVGAYVAELRRTRLGSWVLADCERGLLSLEEVVPALFPVWELMEAELAGLQDGRILAVACEGLKAAFYQGRFVGLVEGCLGGVKFRKMIISAR